ncbi:hypothetical protein ACFWN1_17885 [Streptomyces sp. NPDC058459]|uniref:hypothetical protein n=1 Tax=Streptomyces sp. NPDC058459 TaxID=3346508 RepID=UPI003657BCAB
MDPNEFDAETLDALAHWPVCEAGYGFTRAVWRDVSLTAAWPHVDPLLRRCWAQTWLQDQRDVAREDGYDPDDVVEAFTADRPVHSLWPVFEEVQLASLHGWVQGVHEWGPTAEHKPVGLDLELVYMVPRPASGNVVPEGGAWMPLLMRYDPVAGWRVLNFLAEIVPEPGWPPRLQDAN